VVEGEYGLDGIGVTAPVLSDGASSFTPGISARTSGASKFLHDDRLGTLGMETDANQATTATKTYDAFGMPISTTGSSASPFGFAGGYGYEEDTVSGLKLLGHRYYDPSTSRFLTRDPARDGRNWYNYCGNNPIKSVDPTGLDTYLIVVGEGDRGAKHDHEAIPSRFKMLGFLLYFYLLSLGHKVILRFGPSKAEFYRLIVQVDNLIFIGHGTSGGFMSIAGGRRDKNNDWDLQPEEFYNALVLAKHRLRLIVSFSCKLLLDPTAAAYWRKCAKMVFGFNNSDSHVQDMLDNWEAWLAGDYGFPLPTLTGDKNGGPLTKSVFLPVHTPLVKSK
jgi:RHS repeat-associated protein